MNTHDLRSGPPDEFILIPASRLSLTDAETNNAVLTEALTTPALRDAMKGHDELRLDALRLQRQLSLGGWCLALVLTLAIAPLSALGCLGVGALLATAAIVTDAHLEGRARGIRRQL